MQPDRRELFLKVMLVMAIFMMAGPEIIPAIEMTTLLELLGATLFLTAYSSALRLLAHDVGRFLADTLFPPSLIAAFRQSTRLLEKGSIAGYLFFHVTHCLMMAAVVIVFFGMHVR